MGSPQALPEDAPQQELPPDFTRSAASPYFCFTTSLISLTPSFISVVLMRLLLTDLNDRFRFKCLVARTALGIQEPQQLLERFGVSGVAQKSTLPLDLHQALGLQLLQMVIHGRIRDVELALNVSDDQPFRMRRE